MKTGEQEKKHGEDSILRSSKTAGNNPILGNWGFVNRRMEEVLNRVGRCEVNYYLFGSTKYVTEREKNRVRVLLLRREKTVPDIALSAVIAAVVGRKAEM